MNTDSTIWPDRRLMRAEAAARDSEAVAAWRRLRNLAAAYGRLDLARTAEERRSALAGPVVKRKPAPPPTARHVAAGVDVGVGIRIRSAMPVARAAWLARWAAARGGSLRQESDPDLVTLILPGGRGEIDRLLEAHSELVLVGDTP